MPMINHLRDFVTTTNFWDLWNECRDGEGFITKRCSSYYRRYPVLNLPSSFRPYEEAMFSYSYGQRVALRYTPFRVFRFTYIDVLFHDDNITFSILVEYLVEKRRSLGTHGTTTEHVYLPFYHETSSSVQFWSCHTCIFSFHHPHANDLDEDILLKRVNDIAPDTCFFESVLCLDNGTVVCNGWYHSTVPYIDVRALYRIAKV